MSGKGLGHRLYAGEVSFDFIGRRKQWYIVSGIIQQGSRPGDVMIDLGKVEALLPAAERVAEEKYAHGERIKGEAAESIILAPQLQVRASSSLLRRAD